MMDTLAFFPEMHRLLLGFMALCRSLCGGRIDPEGLTGLPARRSLSRPASPIGGPEERLKRRGRALPSISLSMTLELSGRAVSWSGATFETPVSAALEQFRLRRIHTEATRHAGRATIPSGMRLVP